MLPTNPLLNATAPAGPHLPTATLRQYAAGTLAPAAQHRVEAHTLACPRCADILEGLLQTNATTTDQALAQLSQRLRHRVLLAESTRSPTRTKHRWLVPQLAAAATLLFGLLAGGWWTWQQRHPDLIAGRPVASAPAPPASAPATPAPSAAAATAATAPLLTEAHPRRAAPAHHQPRSFSHSRHLTRAAAKPTQPAAEPRAPRATEDVPAAAPSPAAVAPPASATVALATDSAALAKRPAPSPTPGRAAEPEAARVRVGAMPAAAVIPPTPMGGYAAWREQLRHEAAEFKPELPDRPLSGTVRLRLLIGSDGKIQEIRVLRGIRADYDEEAQRLVCDGPAWVPGVGSGKRAAQAVDVAVPFYND